MKVLPPLMQPTTPTGPVVCTCGDDPRYTHVHPGPGPTVHLTIVQFEQFLVNGGVPAAEATKLAWPTPT